MQTPVEKAIELKKRFMAIETEFSLDGGYEFEHLQDFDARICALITVDEILQCNPMSDMEFSTISYWEDVRKELRK